MANLPDDLLLELLSLLPIDSILRFRFVSKKWRRLIETPYFCRIHHQKQLELNKTKTVSAQIIIALRSHKLYAINISDTDLKPEKLINVPFKNKIKKIQYCNGVLCLLCRHREVVIWNPLSDKYKKLHSPVPQPGSSFVFGFGYDRVSHDYKLIALGVFGDDDIVKSAMVYSVQLDRWNSIDGFTYKLYNSWDDGVFVGDSVHWIVSNKCILAFNLTTDQFHEIPLPSSCCSKLITDLKGMKMSVFSGCLTFTCWDYGHKNTSYVMKVYGNMDSWVMMEFDIYIHPAYHLYTKPITYMDDGKPLIVEYSGYFLLYDTKSKSIKTLSKVGETHCYEATLGFYGGKLDDEGKGGGKAKDSQKTLTNRATNKRAKF